MINDVDKKTHITYKLARRPVNDIYVKLSITDRIIIDIQLSKRGTAGACRMKN